MTCKARSGQAGCGYDFCWQCAGPYHTTSGCSKPVVKGDQGSVLAFSERDAECSSHFEQRKKALQEKEKNLQMIEASVGCAETDGLLRLNLNMWTLIAECLGINLLA